MCSKTLYLKHFKSVSLKKLIWNLVGSSTSRSTHLAFPNKCCRFLPLLSLHTLMILWLLIS